jgi:hypothetical protein
LEALGLAEPLHFLCECGCFGFVAITGADYFGDGGAWLDGHRQDGERSRRKPPG